MRVFLITALCATLTWGKPQYNYPAPSVPATPSGSYGAPGGGVSTGGAGTSFGGGAGAAFGGGAGFGGGFGAGGGGFSATSSQDTSSFSGNRVVDGQSRVASFGGGVATGGGGGGGVLVQKHIYVHVAPPEPEEQRPQRPISVGQATKHYKIIFIKAPSAPSYQQQIIQQQAQNEEKTLVYVLVKKPDEVGDITIPTAAPTQPSKPEVYFIRYKAKSEATGAATGGFATGAASGAAAATASASAGSSAFTGGLSLSAGDSSSSVSINRPATSYGPPGQSGPY